MFAIILLSVFLAGMVAIGIWGMRKTTSLNDFFLGGRTIGPWVSAFAYGTTYFSAVLFIGFAGKLGWVFGLNALWIAAGNTLIGALLAWLVLARRTRRMTQNLDAMTMPGFLEARFTSRNLKLFSAVIIFVFLLPYSASVFKGLGHLFEVNFGISYDLALLIMILITGVYLVLGGYFAITLTDFIQGIIMLGGAVALILVMTGQAGGLTASISTITANYPAHVPNRPPWLLLAALVFMTSFGAWGMPQMVQKFYSIKNEQVIFKAAIITTLFSLVIVFAAYFNGALSHVFCSAVPPGPSGKPEFDLLIPQLLTAHLPEALMAVILLLIVSASMSTLSSLVLVSASSIAMDLYQGRMNPNATQKHMLTVMRVLSGIFVIISFVIAKFKIAIIITLMSLSWGVIAGAFMAPYFYGLYWRRTTRAGVWAGMLSGVTLAISLFYILGDKNAPIASSIAMLVPFAVVPVVSLLTKAPEAQTIEKAFAEI